MIALLADIISPTVHQTSLLSMLSDVSPGRLLLRVWPACNWVMLYWERKLERRIKVLVVLFEK